MRLTSGTRVGPYEVQALLGVGGMGEVYRARDPRIGRDVALKILPEELRDDLDRLRRFHQEAAAPGGLAHPSIIAIHDVGTHEGRPYVVMELADGPTLRERLAAGALPPRKAAHLGAQLADGLAAAHERGIVHRDLKPENLIVAPGDVLKILDFGLARSTGRLAPDGEGATRTAVGAVVGTIGYMAPEQLVGAEVDHRADIFSTGVILYEMLAGVRPFAAASQTTLVKQVLSDDPPPLPDAVPAPLARIVERCMAKDARERFQSARDLGFALSSLGAPPAFPAPSIASAWLWKAATAVLAVVAAALAFLWLGRGERRPEVQPATRLQYAQLTFQPGTVWSARFTADPQTVLYAAAWEGRPNEIFATRRDFPVSQALGISPADLLDVGPKGELALLLTRQSYEGREPNAGRLAQANVSGGTVPRALMDDVASAAWTPDGTIAVARDVDGLRVIEFPIGRRVYSTAGWVSHVRVSADGARLAFANHPTRGDDRGDIRVVTRDGAVTTLTEEFSALRGLAWSARGDAVWFSDSREIFEATLAGATHPVYSPPTTTILYDIAKNGDVLLGSQDERVGVSGMLRGDRSERDFTWFDYSVVTDIAADGSALLFFEAGAVGGGRYVTAVRRVGEEAPLRLGNGRAIGLSPDGTRALTLVFEPSQLVIMPTSIGDTIALTRRDNIRYQSASWMPDGRHIVIAANEADAATRLYVQDTQASDAPLRAISPPGIVYRWHGIRPDGSGVVALGADGRAYLFSLGGEAPRVVPGIEPGDVPIAWEQSGQALFVRAARDFPQHVYRVDAESGRRTLVRTLQPANPSGITRVSPVVMTPDGRHYAYSYARDLTELYVVSGLK